MGQPPNGGSCRLAGGWVAAKKCSRHPAEQPVLSQQELAACAVQTHRMLPTGTESGGEPRSGTAPAIMRPLRWQRRPRLAAPEAAPNLLETVFIASHCVAPTTPVHFSAMQATRQPPARPLPSLHGALASLRLAAPWEPSSKLTCVLLGRAVPWLCWRRRRRLAAASLPPPLPGVNPAAPMQDW